MDYIYELTAFACYLLAAVCLGRGWWLYREGRRIRKDFDYWREHDDRRDR